VGHHTIIRIEICYLHNNFAQHCWCSAFLFCIFFFKFDASTLLCNCCIRIVQITYLIAIRHVVIEKWSLHSFLTTAPQQADVAGNILLLFFCFVVFSFCKKIIKYYQPRQLVVGLLWEMSVGIISRGYYSLFSYEVKTDFYYYINLYAKLNNVVIIICKLK